MVFDGHINNTSRDSTPPPQEASSAPNPNVNATAAASSSSSSSASATATSNNVPNHRGGGGSNSSSSTSNHVPAVMAPPVPMVSCSAAVDDDSDADANDGLSDDEQLQQQQHPHAEAASSCRRCRSSTAVRVRLDPQPKLRTIDLADDDDDETAAFTGSDNDDIYAGDAQPVKPMKDFAVAATKLKTEEEVDDETPAAAAAAPARRAKFAPKPKLATRGRALAAKPVTPPPAASSSAPPQPPMQQQFATAFPTSIDHDENDFGDGTMTEAAEAEHIATESRLVCCYFRQRGECKMGDQCWYSHDDDGTTPCHYGASCKAGHSHLARNAVRSTAVAAVASSKATDSNDRIIDVQLPRRRLASPRQQQQQYEEVVANGGDHHYYDGSDFASMVPVRDSYASVDFDPRYDPETFGVLPEPAMAAVMVSSIGGAAGFMAPPHIAVPMPLVSLPHAPLPPALVQLPGLQQQQHQSRPYRTGAPVESPELAYMHHQQQALAHNTAAASAFLQMQQLQQAQMLLQLQREQQQSKQQQRSRRFVPCDAPCAYCGNSGCVFTQEFPIYNGNNMTIGHRAHCRTCSRTYAL